MGVRGLTKYVIHTLEIGRLKSLKEYEKKIIGIDISILIYKWFNIGRHFGSETYQYECLLSQIAKFKENNITPIYVFDGRPSKAKMKTIEKRKKDTERAAPDKKIWTSCFALIEACGFMAARADGEADHYLAALYKNGTIDYVLSSDSDFLPLGCLLLIPKKDKFVEIEPADILTKLNITKKKFIDFCILLGTDYTYEKFSPMSVKNALTFIKVLERDPGITKDMRAEFDIPKLAKVKVINGAHNAAKIARLVESLNLARISAKVKTILLK